MGYKSDGNLRNGGQMNGKLEHKSKLSPHIEHITVNIICYIQTIPWQPLHPPNLADDQELKTIRVVHHSPACLLLVVTNHNVV